MKPTQSGLPLAKSRIDLRLVQAEPQVPVASRCRLRVIAGRESPRAPVNLTAWVKEDSAADSLIQCGAFACQFPRNRHEQVVDWGCGEKEGHARLDRGSYYTSLCTRERCCKSWQAATRQYRVVRCDLDDTLHTAVAANVCNRLQDAVSTPV